MLNSYLCWLNYLWILDLFKNEYFSNNIFSIRNVMLSGGNKILSNLEFINISI